MTVTAAAPARDRTPTAGQLALVRSLPDNDKAEWAEGNWTLPVGPYVSRERFEAEQAQIFRRLPVPIAPSALLPEKGSFVYRTAYGKELILARDPSGEAGVFLNVCQHRGSRLLETQDQVQRGRLLVCPFH